MPGMIELSTVEWQGARDAKPGDAVVGVHSDVAAHHRIHLERRDRRRRALEIDLVENPRRQRVRIHSQSDRERRLRIHALFNHSLSRSVFVQSCSSPKVSARKIFWPSAMSITGPATLAAVMFTIVVTERRCTCAKSRCCLPSYRSVAIRNGLCVVARLEDEEANLATARAGRSAARDR